MVLSILALEEVDLLAIEVVDSLAMEADDDDYDSAKVRESDYSASGAEVWAWAAANVDDIPAVS